MLITASKLIVFNAKNATFPEYIDKVDYFAGVDNVVANYLLWPHSRETNQAFTIDVLDFLDISTLQTVYVGTQMTTDYKMELNQNPYRTSTV